MKLKPLQDWAVIKPSQEQSMTAGGLYIPDSAKEKQAQGVVEAIGPGALEEEGYGKKKKERKDRKFIPTSIKPGDFVAYEQYAGQTYKVGAEDLILVRERDILGVLPGAPQEHTTLKPHQPSTSASGSHSTAHASFGSKALTKPVTNKKAAKKAAKKAVKKVVSKAVKKVSAKPAKKAVKKTILTKKKAAKKTVKKAAKKTVKKVVKAPTKAKGKAAKTAKKKR